MANFFQLLFTIGCVHIFFGLSNACSCSLQSVEEIYCSSEWVSHVLIQTANLENDTQIENFTPKHWKYTVDHVQVYKPPMEELPNVIVTPEHSATCGVDGLQPGTEYLLEGRFNDNSTLGIFGCSVVNNRRWTWTNGSWDSEGAVKHLAYLPVCGNITSPKTNQ
ncbi:tissue inhibitor of metalloproteinase domain-containing protein [Ditylenchus destructor]|nr:tissue inhibitor of metalloproteinase domain-containing protein [Ditylenchus destructor]